MKERKTVLWMDVDAAWWKSLDDANRKHRLQIAKREAEKSGVEFAGVRLVESVERE